LSCFALSAAGSAAASAASAAFRSWTVSASAPSATSTAAIWVRVSSAAGAFGAGGRAPRVSKAASCAAASAFFVAVVEVAVLVPLERPLARGRRTRRASTSRPAISAGEEAEEVGESAGLEGGEGRLRGTDSTFELDFIHRATSSVVHVLNPTISHDRFQTCLNSSKSNVGLSPNVDKLHFWKVGLSDVSEEVVFARSPDKRIGSLSAAKLAGFALQSDEKMLVVDMPTLYSMLAIDWPVVFKMDIEGSEFKVILSWCTRSKKII
jgi:hypothetical protein